MEPIEHVATIVNQTPSPFLQVFAYLDGVANIVEIALLILLAFMFWKIWRILLLVAELGRYWTHYWPQGEKAAEESQASSYKREFRSPLQGFRPPYFRC